MTPQDLLFKIFELALNKNYSDIHISTGNKPIIRNKSWELENVDFLDDFELPILDITTTSEIIKVLVWDEWLKKFETEMELDSSYNFKNLVRYRINCYKHTLWYSVALRTIPYKIPTFEELWLSDYIKDLCNKQKWLILVTWPTWSWKSTILASIVEYINTTQKKHIITIEDPVEFSFVSKKSLINQREVWNSTKWFANAIKFALREDPNVIMVWEMRDPETIKSVLTLAETWHLVISTLHTNDSVQTIDRIVDVFPGSIQKQIRMQLAMSLIWIISQRLLPRKWQDARIAAREILIANDAIRNLIITAKTNLIYSVLEVGSSSWMFLMDKYLTVLYKNWFITKETLLSYARDKESVSLIIN